MTKLSQWVTTMASRTPGSTVSMVGQGSFLDKPSLLMVGYMGKNSPSINTSHDGWCPVCKTKGQTKALKTYRINFTQSIFLCTDPQCIYPLGYTPLDNIIANTADLKKSSPKKHKKRHLSDLSPTPLPCEKRPKIDLPIIGDSHADLCKSVPGFPALECETSSPTRSQHDLKECTDPLMQNVSGPTNSVSSYSFCDMSSFPVLPLESSWPSCTGGNPLGLPGTPLLGVLQNGDLEVMDTLNNYLLPILPNADLMASKVDEEQEKVTEMTEREEHMMNGLTFSTDHIPSYVSPPAPENSQQECQVKENTSEMSVHQNNIDIVSNLACELPQSREFVKDSPCLIEPPLLQHRQTEEPKENMDDLTNEGDVEASSCNKEASLSIQDSPTEISGNAVSPKLQHECSDQQMNLLEISPPTCPEAAENSFGSANLSESLKLMQESCEMIDSSQSLEDVPQECPAEGLSLTDLRKQVFPPPCSVAEGGEKGLSTLPLCELECQLESLSKDSSVTPTDLTTLVPKGSMVGTEDPSIPIASLSLMQELVQTYQKTNSEEHNSSEFVQDVLHESQDEEKALKNSCDNPTTSALSVKDQDCADATAISSPGNQLSKTLDTTQAFQKNDIATPAESLLDNQPACHTDVFLEKVCEPHDTSASNMTDECNAQPDAKFLNKMSLLGPKVLLKDCLKCHCEINMSSRGLQNTLCGVKDITDCKKGLTHGDGKSQNKLPLPGPQVLLKDCLKCHCGTNVSSQCLQNTQTLNENSAPEVGSRVCGDRVFTDTEKVSDNKDSNSVATVENATAAPPMECKSPLAQQKKNFYENTILPDLLLDIQPEHRMDEPLSTAPSPACDVAATVASDMESTKQDVWQNGQDEQCDNVMEHETTEVMSDNAQEDSKMSDALETSLNSEADDGSDEIEAKTEGAAQVNKAPTLRRLKQTERRLQWKNKHSLCWLDCILSALVQSETLNHFVAGGHLVSKESIVRNLFTNYDEATKIFLKSLKKRRTDQRRPKYEKCLNEVRTSIFEKLKPLLKCKLGKKDSPVFAFPLLLNQDPETEKLFMHSFMWKFKCEVCGHSYQQSCQKTLTTFTKVLPDWRPLNAVHTGPCNKCHNTEQKRSMVLDKLNSIFMVHFVEGLPSSDLNKYSFEFQGHSYEVKAVIKYKNKHFSTWISCNDGTWFESDDLRGSFCRRHQKFRVRADDIHIVIWERSSGVTFEEIMQLGAEDHDTKFNSTNVSMASQDESISSMDATELSQQDAPTVPSVALNASDPLAGMECYADDDVITLTLVEVPLDANGRPVETPPELQLTDTCISHEETNKEVTHIAQPGKSTNIQLESKDHCTLPSPIPSDSNAKTVPHRNVSVVPCPLIQSPLKPGKAIATSTPTQKPCNLKSSGVGKWITRLIQKDRTILNTDPLVANKKVLTLATCPPLKVTDSSGAIKKAQNFNSFQGRSMSKTSILPSNTASESFSIPKEKGTPVAKPLPTPAPSGFRLPGSNALDYGKHLSKEGSSSNEDKIRKLRLKLLKKLRAKKNELATLEKLAKGQSSGPFGNQANGLPQGRFNRKEHLQGFLQELQEHIDNADNESVCTISSSTSICSSPGDAEFFTELFSPSPVNQQNASNFLEMLADGCGISAAGHLQQANDHQRLGDVLQSASRSSNSCLTTSTLNKSSREESLNLMSNSTLAVLNAENDHFDFNDYF